MGSDPDILVDLTTARNSFEAQVIAQALEAQGVPAKAFDIAGTMLQWDVAVSQPIRVVVRRRDLELARSILKAIKADSLDLDWSEVKTGDPTPETEAERAAAAERGEPTGVVLERGRRAGVWVLAAFGLVLVIVAVLLLSVP
jgi:hypothetical protein